MTIDRVNATFGKLDHEEMTFHEGLNLIHAPNESGKSTWCAFIRAMLYGIDSTERARAGTIPEKKKYQPWSGAVMEGSMDLRVDGREITLQRGTSSQNAPMRDFTAVYTGTAIPVPDLTGTNCGEQLTGLSRDAFCRSAFIGQGAVAATGGAELERRINAIVSTGEEAASFPEADERLKTWENRRKYNNRGFIPELEDQIREDRRQLDEITKASEEVEQLTAQLQSVKDDCTRLELAVSEARRTQRKNSLDELSRSRARLADSTAKHDAAIRELNEARLALRDSPFGSASLEDAEKETEDDLTALKKWRAESRSGCPAWIFAVLLAAAIVLAGIYTAADSLWMMIAALVCCAGGLIMLFRYANDRKRAKAASAAYGQILAKYHAKKPDDIRAALERYSELWERVNSAVRAERKTAEQADAAEQAQQDIETAALQALDFADGTSDAVRFSRLLADKRRQAEQLTARIASLQGSLAAIGDPVALSSQISEQESRLHERQEEYEAIRLARAVLKESDTEIKSRFSPRLGTVAGAYMSSVTDGKYSDVTLNRDFTAMTRQNGEELVRQSEYLSAGTYDLLYLAVRLAVCELAMPDAEPCPLIIDDALVNLDAERFRQALRLLADIAKGRQVILFTCREQ